MKVENKDQGMFLMGFLVCAGLSVCFVVLSLLALFFDGQVVSVAKAKVPYQFLLVHKHKHKKKHQNGTVLDSLVMAHVNVFKSAHSHEKKSKQFVYGTHEMKWPNGRLRLQEKYCDKKLFKLGKCLLGRLHGFSRGWFSNGQIRWEKQYKDGLISGVVRSWYSRGHSNLLSTFMYVKGKKHGLFQKWRWDGSLVVIGSYHNDKKQGLWKRWYPNGKLMEKAEYQDGKKHGLWQQWFWICKTDGCFHLKFRDGFFHQGKKHGRWSLWNVSTGKALIQQWKHGTKVL